jgi:hypothetical protein
MLRRRNCSGSILIYVVGVSSLSVAEQPLLPLSWEERSRRQLLETERARQAEAEARATARV